MSANDDAPKVLANHDSYVRQLALEHAVTLASRAGYGGSQAAAVVEAAERFRAFLTVPGATGHYVVQSDNVLRAHLPLKGTVVLPQQVTVAAAGEPRPGRDLLAEFREIAEFARWLATREAADPTPKE